jgi:hypothetical protein
MDSNRNKNFTLIKGAIYEKSGTGCIVDEKSE